MKKEDGNLVILHQFWGATGEWKQITDSFFNILLSLRFFSQKIPLRGCMGASRCLWGPCKEECHPSHSLHSLRHSSQPMLPKPQVQSVKKVNPITEREIKWKWPHPMPHPYPVLACLSKTVLTLWQQLHYVVPLGSVLTHSLVINLAIGDKESS